ncbi:hypothetical protein [Nocardia sp. NPDC059691]|uniref:WXG100-like domain-containing protein n=1 Tax=Nocardia sp. NPDC059691 TaxID=3346908 RepID=UPI00367DBC15
MFFLDLCGVPYPDINEDHVRDFADHVRTFSTNIQQTHESATQTVKDIGSVYSGYSYDQLAASWAQVSATHIADFDHACRTVATALDVAAGVITAMKVAVIAELAAMAASYAAVIASPAGPAAAPLLTAAARRLCTEMQEALVQYIAIEIVSKAIEPFEDTIDRMINGVVYDAMARTPGMPSDSAAAKMLSIEPDEVLRYADILTNHADEVLRHATIFADNVSQLDFTTETDQPGALTETTVSTQRTSHDLLPTINSSAAAETVFSRQKPVPDLLPTINSQPDRTPAPRIQPEATRPIVASVADAERITTDHGNGRKHEVVAGKLNPGGPSEASAPAESATAQPTTASPPVHPPTSQAVDTGSTGIERSIHPRSVDSAASQAQVQQEARPELAFTERSVVDIQPAVQLNPDEPILATDSVTDSSQPNDTYLRPPDSNAAPAATQPAGHDRPAATGGKAPILGTSTTPRTPWTRSRPVAAQPTAPAPTIAAGTDRSASTSPWIKARSPAVTAPRVFASSTGSPPTHPQPQDRRVGDIKENVKKKTEVANTNFERSRTSEES